MDHVPQMVIQQQTIEDNNGQENALGDQQDKTSKQYSYHKSNNVTVTHKFPVIDHINSQDFLLPIAALLFFFFALFFFYMCVGCFPSHVWRWSPCRLTLSLPEDPCAHELEEAAGIKPRPVHRDGVLRTGREDIRVCDQKEKARSKAAVCQTWAGNQLTPSYTRAFHECSNFLMNLGRTKTRRSFVTCIHLPKTSPFLLDQTCHSFFFTPWHNIS